MQFPGSWFGPDDGYRMPLACIDCCCCTEGLGARSCGLNCGPMVGTYDVGDGPELGGKFELGE